MCLPGDRSLSPDDADDRRRASPGDPVESRLVGSCVGCATIGPRCLARASQPRRAREACDGRLDSRIAGVPALYRGWPVRETLRSDVCRDPLRRTDAQGSRARPRIREQEPSDHPRDDDGRGGRPSLPHPLRALPPARRQGGVREHVGAPAPLVDRRSSAGRPGPRFAGSSCSPGAWSPPRHPRCGEPDGHHRGTAAVCRREQRFELEWPRLHRRPARVRLPIRRPLRRGGSRSRCHRRVRGARAQPPERRRRLSGVLRDEHLGELRRGGRRSGNRRRGRRGRSRHRGRDRVGAGREPPGLRRAEL